MLNWRIICAESKLSRAIKSWTCRFDGCSSTLFDNLGSFVEHLHNTHNISDFTYLKHAAQISEAVFFIDTSCMGRVDKNQQSLIVSEDLNEMVEYFDRVEKNKREKMIAFNNKIMVTGKKDSRAEYRHHGKPIIRMQNLCSGSIYQQSMTTPSNLAKHPEPETATSKQESFKLALFDDVNVEGFDPNNAEETAEESRLTSDIFYSNHKSQRVEPLTAIKQLIQAEFLDGLTLAKRESQGSDPELIAESPEKKTKQFTAANIRSEAPHALEKRFVSSFGLGNLTRK